MNKANFFLVMVVWGVLGVTLTSLAQTGYRLEEEREVTSRRETDISTVRVYGPDALTDLVRQAIQEEWPGVAVETYYKPLKNKVRIEGAAGTGYMPLSPKRVERMQAERAKRGSVYAALCSQQKGVIQKTVGEASDWVRIERKEYRTERRMCYVRPICPPPPPPAIFVPPVNVGVVIGGPYPPYGYRAHGMWGGRGDHSYRGTRAHPRFYPAHGGHSAVGPFPRGRR